MRHLQPDTRQTIAGACSCCVNGANQLCQPDCVAPTALPPHTAANACKSSNVAPTAARVAPCRSIEALTTEAVALRAASSEAMTAYAEALRSPRRPPGRSLEDLHVAALRATQARTHPDCEF